MERNTQENKPGSALNENLPTVLVVEDDEGTNHLICKTLEREGFKTARALNGADALAAARAMDDSVVLLDYFLPDMNGKQIIMSLREEQITLPLIIITGNGDERIAVDIMKLGARDYIIKERGFIENLPKIIRRTIESMAAEKELARMERALWRSEEKFRKVFFTSPDSISINRLSDGMFVSVNKGFEELSGYSEKEVIGKTSREINIWYNPEDQNRIIDELKAKGRVENYEARLLTKTREIWGLISASSIELNGERHILNITRPITERKLAADRERLARDVLDLLNRPQPAQDAICGILHLIKHSTGIRAAGIRLRKGDDFPYYETDGFSEDFVQAERFLCERDESGKPMRDKSGNPALECMCGAIIQGRTDPALPFFTKGGSFWTNCTTDLSASTTEKDLRPLTRNHCNGEGYESVALIPLHSGDAIIGLLQLNDRRKDQFTIESIQFFEGLGAAIGIAMARKKAEEELRLRNTIMSTQLETSTDGILVVDGSGSILSFNRRFVDMWDIPPGAMQSKYDGRVLQSMMDKLTDPEQFMDKVKHLYKAINETGIDDITLKDGRTFERYSAPMYDAEVKYYGRVWYFSDVTERKQAEEKDKKLEEQLRQSEKLEAIGQLSSGIAHDFNNLLGGVMGHAEMLKMNLNSGSPLVRYPNVIISLCEKASDLTRQLLTFARKAPVEFQKIDLNAVIKQAVGIMERTIDRRIEIIVDIPEQPVFISGDKNQLENALLNIAINARDAMPEGGRVSIASETMDLDQTALPEEHSNVTEGSYIMISIADTGTGMSKEPQSRIFEPFFTTKELGKGTGLGLASVYGCVKQHNGYITVESQEGKGTKFTIYLPLIKSTGPIAGVKEEAAIAPGKGSLLVVDDEPIYHEIITNIFGGLGYTVHCCAEGAEAVAFYSEHMSTIDVVILDMNMPKMTGLHCFEHLKEINPGVRVIVSSGYGDNSDREALRKEGVCAFVQKPYKAAELSAKITELMDAT